MPLFTYSAAQSSGTVIKGEREAADDKALAQTLKLEGLIVLEARERRGLRSRLNVNLGDVIARIRPVSIVEKMFFSRNLAVMVGAGLSLTKGMEALSQEAKNPKLRQVIADINDSVVKGNSFADSLRRHQKVFGELFINMVEVGETTGKLTLVLKLLANQMKKDYALRKRVRGAMAYPGFILIALVGIGTMMMIYVVPTLTAVIKELGVPLPVTTRIIIALSENLIRYGLWILAGAAALGLGFWRAHKSARAKAYLDRAALRIPLFGPLIHNFNTARFCRILSYLITSGVPIVRSLEVTAGVLSNTVFRDAVREAAIDVQKGTQLRVILAGHPKVFRPLVTQMVGVGEETGKISEMLLRLALFFEEEVTSVTKNMSTLIEPVMMVAIGIAVGFFAISMLQPIYTSLGSIGV